MSFSTALDAYCKVLKLTNIVIAEQCGISPSALSRYRNGMRTPEANSQVVNDLAKGIATLSHKDNTVITLQQSEVLASLKAELTGSQMVGMDFSMRLDELMNLLGMRNATLAQEAGIDPSYVSRIRSGQRTPADMMALVEPCAREAARLCLEQDSLDTLAQLIDQADDIAERLDFDLDPESDLAETIASWLLGDQIFEADLIDLERLFAWLDRTDLSKWLSIAKPNEADNTEDARSCPAHLARFYYGLGGMRNAELTFMELAVSAQSREMSLSSDTPLLHMEMDRQFRAKYRQGIDRILQSGCHVNIIHSVEQPLRKTIRAVRTWIPLYCTGCVTPYYLKGINNRLFLHVNYVCDVCALASEAVMGHEAEGRYYLSTRPEDVAYYQRKMSFILDRSSSLLEIYRECEPGRREAFEQSEAERFATGRGRVIGADRFKNLRLVAYPGECASVSVPCGDTAVHFVIRHPKLHYAIAHMK